jgi:hypothetical protein
VPACSVRRPGRRWGYPYNDVHSYLVESNAQTRREWIAALDTIESLNPRAVIAGHKKPEKDDNPGIIEETRQYIRDFERVAETSTTARELYDKMLKLYPDHRPRRSAEFSVRSWSISTRRRCMRTGSRPRTWEAFPSRRTRSVVLYRNDHHIPALTQATSSRPARSSPGTREAIGASAGECRARQ